MTCVWECQRRKEIKSISSFTVIERLIGVAVPVLSAHKVVIDRWLVFRVVFILSFICIFVCIYRALGFSPHCNMIDLAV